MCGTEVKTNLVFWHECQFDTFEALCLTTRASFLERGTKNNPLYSGSGTGYQKNLFLMNKLDMICYMQSQIPWYQGLLFILNKSVKKDNGPVLSDAL